MRRSITTIGQPCQRSSASDRILRGDHFVPGVFQDLFANFQLAGVVFHHQNASHQANSMRAITSCGI